MSDDNRCLNRCMIKLFNLSDDSIPETFVDHSDWLDRLSEFALSLGYKMYRVDNIDELDIPTDKYLVWGMSRRGNPHSAIHSKGHLIYDFVDISDKDDEFITDYYHKTCDKWIHGVIDIYQYVWFMKI